MKLNNAIRRELVFVAAGLAVGDALICAVFALLHKFDYTVPLGAVWGSAFAFLNVYLLALRVQKVADSEDADKKIAQNRLRSSYFGRMMLMVFAIIVGVIVPWFHYISALIPFLIPQPVMMLRRAIVTAREKRGADNSDKGESE
jgi:ABC-type Fe3+-siderophore transport system permease subunit